MKKRFLVGGLVLAALQTPQASSHSFNGFYVGGHLGSTQRHDKTTFQALDIEEQRPASRGGGRVRFEQNALHKTNKAYGLNYGLYFGYGQILKSFYWGGEFNVSYDTANKGNTNNNLEVKANGVSRSGTGYHGRLYTKYERGVVFGFTPRIGIVIADVNLVYFKLGIEYSEDKLLSVWKGIQDGSPVGHQDPLSVVRKKQIVFVPGFGYERAFGNLLTRIEYGYTVGAKIQSPPLIKEAYSNEYHCPSAVRYSAHTLKLGIAYKF